MKICFITPYPPKQGGLSAYSKRIVSYMTSQPPGIKVSVVPFNSFTDILDILAIGKKKHDVVRLEYNIPAYGLASIPIFLILLVNKIFTKTIFVVNFHEIKRETDMFGFFGTMYFKIFSLAFDKIYVHTSEAQKILEKKCHINPKKIFTIPLGTYLFENKTDYIDEIRKQYNLNNKRTVLYFGYIHPDKGIEYLLKAIKRIKIQHPSLYTSIQVIIAGDVRSRSGIFKYFEKKDMDYKKYLIDLTQILDIGDTIHFLGFIKEKYIYSLLNSAHVIVFPYTKVEQSGVLNMVLPLNKPIIASNIGGLGETLSETGVLVKAKDHQGIANEIIKLLHNQAYYKQISTNYKTLSTEIDVSQVTKKFMNSLNV